MSTEISTDSVALHIPLHYITENYSTRINLYVENEYPDRLGMTDSEYLDSLGRPASEYNYGYTYIGEYESKFTESDAQGDPVPM